MSGQATTTTTVTDETEDPIERRMFQFTDLVDNHNKFYMVELWPAPGQTSDKVRFRASWGRVGARPQVKEKIATRNEVARQIDEKVRKGYRPVELHRPEFEPPAPDPDAPSTESEPQVRIDPRVAQLLELIYAEAGEYIQSYLAVAVEALSQAQINEGRRLLAEAQKQHAAYRLNPFKRDRNLQALAATVQAYYNAIPTRLPARVDRDKVVLDFCGQFSEQENRLLQLEAAIATIKTQRKHPGYSQYQSLGAQIDVLAPDHPVYGSIMAYINRTQVHGYKIKVKDVFEVCIPEERKAYEQNKRGTSRRELLFHGTRNGNIRHILRTGLICPRTPSNGRMLGSGIYLANKASKSANYCMASRRGLPGMLLVVEAALGKCYVAPRAEAYNAPPRGYDSVMGMAGRTSIGGPFTLMNDEFVVYSPAQQTIRYLVTFER